MGERCPLCRADAELEFSHIVPEWCYAPAYDPKHRAKRINVDVGEKQVQPMLIQKGIRERLLCGKCERRIGAWERTVKNTWFDKLPDEVGAELQDVSCDYAAGKLCVVSVFWRASIARGPEWESAKLSHEEDIRQLLSNGDPGPENSFPIQGRLLVRGRRVVRGLVTKPQASSLNGMPVVYMCFAGVEWTLIDSLHAKDQLAQSSFKPTSRMLLLPQELTQCNTIRIFQEQRREAMS